MKKTLLWILFFVFLILISPLDLTPGPVDDVVYGILDVIIIALLGVVRDKKKKALPPSEKGESAGVNDKR